MKKAIAIGLSALMCASFVACGGGQKPAPEVAPEPAQSAEPAQPAAEAAQEPAASAEAAESKLDQIKKAGKLVMYTNPEFPPYETVDGNEVVGVDVEIAKRIADKIGVELEIVSAEFGGIVASIASGKGDIALSGITITQERAKTVDFSVPYVNSIQYVIVEEGSNVEYFEDLAGKKIGAQLGTTGAMFVEDEMDDGVLTGGNSELLTYNSAPSAMQDLRSGRLDAVVIDELVAIAIAAENPGFVANPLSYQDGEPVREYFGACIAKGNEDFLEVINEVVDELVKNGEIDKFLEMFEE